MIFIHDLKQVDVSVRDVLADIASAEGEADLKAKDGMIRATPTFLRSLSRRLRARGFENATSATAWQVWIAVTHVNDQAREVTVEMAELAFWYGIDPFTLTETQRIGLMANLHRVQAQKTIHSGSYSPTDYLFVHDLFLIATGDKELARRQEAKALEAYTDAQMAGR